MQILGLMSPGRTGQPFCAREPSAASIANLVQELARLGGIIDHVEQGAGAEDRRAEEVATALRKLAGTEVTGDVDVSLTDRHAEGSPDDGNDDRTARYRVDVIFSRAIARRAETTVTALTRLGRMGRMIRIDPPRLSGDPPRFDGKILHVSKVPYNAEAYKAARTQEEKRKAYCFCNLVREAKDPKIDPIFCYRAAGWARQFWEPLLEVEFKKCVITHSILKGDGFCAWDYHLG